jgi:hypothetical protein
MIKEPDKSEIDCALKNVLTMWGLPHAISKTEDLTDSGMWLVTEDGIAFCDNVGSQLMSHAALFREVAINSLNDTLPQDV